MMTEHDYVDWRDNNIAKNRVTKPETKQYVYILLDDGFEEFDDVFSGIYATEEAANEAADRLCKYFYKDNPRHRRDFKIRKEEVKN